VAKRLIGYGRRLDGEYGVGMGVLDGGGDRRRGRGSFWGEFDTSVTKVTFHLPPTATHLLGEWTLPSRALVLCSSEALHLFQ